MKILKGEVCVLIRVGVIDTVAVRYCFNFNFIQFYEHRLYKTVDKYVVFICVMSTLVIKIESFFKRMIKGLND